MNITQEQMSGLLLDLASGKDGFNQIMKATLEALMSAEREVFKDENQVYSNGFRPRMVQGFGKEIALSVPRTRSGGFYPVLLGVLREENAERQKLIFSLYKKGLTTEQIGCIYEEVYGQHYSKSQVSYLMNGARQDVAVWLERSLEEHYLVIYIDATFVSTRRDDSVKKEAYYSVLGVKTDGTREVLAVVNHPNEGSTLWHSVFESLKKRGLKTIGLCVSDGLSSIETALAKSFPNTDHQLCVFHFKRNITSVFPRKLRQQINDELKEVFLLETNSISVLDGYNRLLTFINTWEKKYPSIKSFKNERSIYYFTYLNYPAEIQRMIYTTNWIERLNRDYKRTLKMRGALPSPSSALFLIGSVAQEKSLGTYSYPVTLLKETEELRSKILLTPTKRE